MAHERAENTTTTTLLIGGAVLTIDRDRRLLDPGAVAVDAGYIVGVGTPEELERRYPLAERVDLRHALIMPGLIDAHGHGGHGLTKEIAEGHDWLAVVAHVYFQAADDEFWRADGYLSALERLEFGVTTSLSMIGSKPRIDDPRYAFAAAEGYAALGLRHVVAMGPPSMPWPRRYYDVAQGREVTVDLDQMLANTEAIVERLHGSAGGRISAVVGPSELTPEVRLEDSRATDLALAEMRGVLEIARRRGVGIHAHAYGGQVTAAARSFPDILSPNLSLAHCTGLTVDECRILAETGVSAIHGPLTHAYVLARFPVREALDLGVNVVIGTDGSGPDRSFDLLSQGRVAAQLQRVYFGDPALLPAGKVLEMMTVDAARALGLEGEIGSIEPGKRADLIAINLRSAHMAPRLMLLQRLVSVASGLDVEFVMVDGRVLMRDRQVVGVDVDRILDDADRAARDTFNRAGIEDELGSHPNTWGHVRY
jgi:cytosine/adenosine deaminase-related metal-dependent hydrolase